MSTSPQFGPGWGPPGSPNGEPQGQPQGEPQGGSPRRPPGSFPTGEQIPSATPSASPQRPPFAPGSPSDAPKGNQKPTEPSRLRPATSSMFDEYYSEIAPSSPTPLDIPPPDPTLAPSVPESTTKDALPSTSTFIPLFGPFASHTGTLPFETDLPSTSLRSVYTVTTPTPSPTASDIDPLSFNIPPTSISNPFNQNNQPTDGSLQSSGSEASHGPKPAVLAAAVIIPILILISLGATLFLCLRRRRQRQGFRSHYPLRGGASNSSLEKLRPTAQVMTYNNPVLGVAATNFSTQHPLSTPANPTPPAFQVLNRPPPPVLMPSLLSTNNNAYLTGIDTSESISIISSTHSAYEPRYSSEEPPPPYRPRSVLDRTSRASSVRRQHSTRSGTSTLGAPPSFSTLPAQGHGLALAPGVRRSGSRASQDTGPVLSPFEDDEMSAFSFSMHDGESGRRVGARELDELSEVSEIDYQGEAVRARPGF